MLIGTVACASARGPTETLTPTASPTQAVDGASENASEPVSLAATPTSAVVPPTSAATPAPAPLTGGVVLIGDIVAPPSFDPRATLIAAKSRLLGCYNEARRLTPSLRGKVTLRINVNEAGSVVLVDAVPGGTANDPMLIACLGEGLRTVKFAKPGGSATVSAPLVFRP